MKIGIFDSGIGGLSVLHHAAKQLPHAQFIYYADEKHVPYGEKTIEEIRGYITEAVEFLINKGVDAIVIACNTATSAATPDFRFRFQVPIVGMEPAVKKAMEIYGEEHRRILVAATPVTIAGEKLRRLLERVDVRHEVDLVSLPKLVRFAEQGDFTSDEVEIYLREALAGKDLNQYSTLVLGCTHFNYFKDMYRKVFPDMVHFVDGNGGTIRQLIRSLPDEDSESGQKDSSVEYYFSGEPVTSPEDLLKLRRYWERLDKMYPIE